MLSFSPLCAENINWDSSSPQSILKDIDGIARSLAPTGNDNDTGDIAGNIITVNDSTNKNTIGGSVFGAFNTTQNIANNQVIFDKGTIHSNIMGGRSLTGSVSNNSATMNGGDLRWSMYGGSSKSGDVSKNTAIFNNGIILTGKIIGGESQSGEVGSNHVQILGQGSASIVSGAYGGSSGSGNVINNSVEVTGGTITNAIYGGFRYGASTEGMVSGNSVDINSQGRYTSIANNIYGGHNSNGSADSNRVSSSGGVSFTRTNIYGGYSQGGSANYNGVYIRNSANSGLKTIIGGRTDGGDANDNRVSINSSHVAGYVYAASAEHSARSNNLSFKDSKADEIFGAYGKYGTVSYNSVTINATRHNTTVINKDVYAAASSTGEVSNNTLNFYNGTVIGSIYGGFSSNSAPVTDNTVNVDDGMILGVTYGGRSESGVANKNTVNIKGGNFINSIYGGYSKDSTAQENRVTVSKGSTLYQTRDIYGAYGYNGATKNSVEITENFIISGFVYGGVSYEGDSNENSVTISKGTIYGDIIGGFSNTKIAKNNTVIIKGNPNITDSVIYGGKSNYVDNVSGNTLNFYSKGITAKNIANFENINFIMPKNTAAGDTLLKLIGADKTDLSKSTIGLTMEGGGDSPLVKEGDKVTLISTQAGLIKPKDMENKEARVQALAGVSKIYDFKLKADEKDLYISIDKTPVVPPAYTINPATKSFLEADLASTAFVNQGGDMISSNGVRAIKGADIKERDLSTFVLMGGSKLRYNTGSHVDVKGYNVAAGISKQSDSASYGLFFEYAKGNYDSFNSFSTGDIKGNGNTKYYGLGVLSSFDLANNFYIDNSLRVGRSSTNYNSNDFFKGTNVKFDLDRTYIGAHLGAGKIFDISSSQNIDLYTKLIYLRQSGEEVTIRGDEISFKAINSLRTKLGAKYNFSLNEASSLYLGAAYEKEFSATAKAYNHAVKQDIDSPSLKGNSALFELGTNYNINAVSFNANIQGYAGDKRGVTGGVKAEFRF